MIICDTSGLIAYFDASDRHAAAVAKIIEEAPGPFVVSPYVFAELDYLVMTRRGVAAELAILDELSGGAWDLACLDAAEVRQARDIVRRYRDQSIGLADASLAVLAHRYRTDQILTLDRRHFGVVRAVDGGAFSLLP